MARKRREALDEEDGDLNLAPIMNMVIILIPLLLLSVVFLKVGVINITAPKLATGPPSETPPPDEEKPLNLTVAIGKNGFRIGASEGNMSPVGGCPADGPTICLANQNMDVGAKFAEARNIMSAGGGGALTAGEAVLEEGLQAYNWRALYNELSKIKERFPNETIVNISADSDVPFAAVVRTMDVVRYRLAEKKYDDESAFWAAAPIEKVEDGKKGFEELFSDPVLAVAQ